MDTISVTTVVISALGVLIALWAIWSQARQNNLALGANMLHSLEEWFHWSERLRNTRLGLAQFLLNRKADDDPSGEVADILDFFDGVGLYLAKGILDKEMVWVVFYYWFGHYWQFLKADIDYYERLDRGIVYRKHIKSLHKKLTRFACTQRQMPPEEEYYTPDNLKMFLEEEVEQCSRYLSLVGPFQPEARTSSGRFSPLLVLSFGRKKLWVGTSDRTVQELEAQLLEKA